MQDLGLPRNTHPPAFKYTRGSATALFVPPSRFEAWRPMNARGEKRGSYLQAGPCLVQEMGRSLEMTKGVNSNFGI